MKLSPDMQNGRINLNTEDPAELLPEGCHNIISRTCAHYESCVFLPGNAERQFINLLAPAPRRIRRLSGNSLRRKIVQVLVEISVHTEIPFLASLILVDSGF